MSTNGTHSSVSARILHVVSILCTAVALCTVIPPTASAIERTGTLPVTTLHDVSCLGDDPIALVSVPGGRFLFSIDKDGTVCKIDVPDMSVEGTVQVPGGFGTSRPHVEFTPDGATMLANGAKGVCAIDVNDLTITTYPSTSSDYMMSPDGAHISVVEPDATDDDSGTTGSRSWALRTFSTTGGKDVATVPLQYAVADEPATGIRDVVPYTTNSTGTVWFVGTDDGRSSRLMAIDVATGVMDDIADDVSPTIYATGTANRHALYVGTIDSRVLSIDVDAYDPNPKSNRTTIVRTMFERHLPLDRILLSSNGTRLLVGMTNGKLVVEEGAMQWLDTGNLVSAINPDGTLLYSIDHNGSEGTGTGDATGSITLRVNAFAKNDPTVTRTLSFGESAGDDGYGLSDTAYDRTAGWTFSQDGDTWFVLLAPIAGSRQPAVLLAVDVSPFTTESVSRSTSGNRPPQPLSTPTIAIVVSGAALLVVAIMIVRRRTTW